MKFKFIYLVILFIIISGCTIRPIEPLEEPKPQLELWVGKYDFYEFWDNSANDIIRGLYYRVHIFEEENEYYADIDIDGWMTLVRWRAKVQSDDESIDLILYEFLSDNMTQGFLEIGDILWTLRKEENDILTYWVKWKPELIENQESGKVYFVKNQHTAIP